MRCLPCGSQAGSIVSAWPTRHSTAPVAASGRLLTCERCRLPPDASHPPPPPCPAASGDLDGLPGQAAAPKPIAEQLQQLQADKKVDTVAAVVKLKGKMKQRRQKELGARGQEDAQRRMQVVSGCLLCLAWALVWGTCCTILLLGAGSLLLAGCQHPPSLLYCSNLRCLDACTLVDPGAPARGPCRRCCPLRAAAAVGGGHSSGCGRAGGHAGRPQSGQGPPRRPGIAVRHQALFISLPLP
jgi:hypothetical protein